MGPDTYQKMSEISDSMVLVKVPPLLDGAKATIEDVKIKNGQWINKGQLMVVLKIKENTTDIKTRRIKSETSGRVESVHVRKGEETSADNILARISMSKCPHSTVMKNMCADCGADLEHEEQHLGILFLIITVLISQRAFEKLIAYKQGFTSVSIMYQYFQTNKRKLQ